jgi:predicted nuclease of predicted toxin-antitoxin system
MTNFICVTFGSSNYNSIDGTPRWWNNEQRFDTQRSAERRGLELLSVAGTFGYVVIKETEDLWEVVDELGAPSHYVSISCGNYGTYSVQPAPQLALV